MGPTQVSKDNVAQAKTTPPLQILAEIREQSLITLIDPLEMQDSNRLRQLGEGVLSGNVQFAGRPMAALPFPFRASHLESEQDSFVVRRVKDLLSIRFADGRDERVELLASADVDARRRDIVSAYEAANREFPGVRDLTFYRYRLTMLALILLAVQEAVIAATRRLWPSAAPALRTLASIAWLSCGLLAAFWYLR